MKSIVTAGLLAAMITTAAARDQAKTMPTEFIGDWCFFNEDNDTTFYRLPSWRVEKDDHCTKIISISQYGFTYADDGFSCEPIRTRLSKDVAPSGTTYEATITARCQIDGTVNPVSRLQKFKFSRYKGNMDVTTEWGD